MSRLARSSKDWHQLLELCAVFGSLLADLDGLYDPAQYNDRLLLGLKGTMSEAELHLLRMRLTEGKWNKAERGELFGRQPTGYVRQPSGEVILDPDEQVQSVLRLIFEKFEELGTGRQVFWYLRKNGIRIPVRLAYGPNQGQLEWREPAPSTLHRILRHPQYAGAYVYGRSLVDPRRKIPGRPGTGQTRLPMEQWPVLRRDAFPAYITWQQYLANQERLKQNASQFETRGAPREGPSLLAGLVTCARCGRRMYVGYRGSPTRPIYCCRLDDPAFGNCRGQNLSASVVDELVARQVLQVLEPAAVEFALQAEAKIQREQDRLEKHWRQELERAQYKTERARRQYDAVEPENRLVARELERHWERALLAQRKAQEEYERFQQTHPKDLSAADRQQILALSLDIPATLEVAFDDGCRPPRNHPAVGRKSRGPRSGKDGSRRCDDPLDRWLHQPARDTSLRLAIYGPSRSRPADRPAEGTTGCWPYRGGDRTAAQRRGLPLAAPRARIQRGDRAVDALSARSHQTAAPRCCHRRGLPQAERVVVGGICPGTEDAFGDTARLVSQRVGACSQGDACLPAVHHLGRRQGTRSSATAAQVPSPCASHVPYPSELTTPNPRTDR